MKYVNPYHFIPLSKEGSKKDIKEYTENKDLYTGKLCCHLVTQTPILVPDHEKMGSKQGMDKNGKMQPYEEYPFMTINGKPVIPGSSLRGVIRSTFEAITDSCLFTNDDYYFFSRTGEPKKPALLEKIENGWRLHEAKRYPVIKDYMLSGIETGDIVQFSLKCTIRTQREFVSRIGTGADMKKGYVLKMNQFWNSKSKRNSAYSVFEKVANKAPIVEWDESHDLVQVFYENLKKYVENEKKKPSKPGAIYKAKLDSLKFGGMIPVWYQKSNGKYYLAPSQLSRNVYVRKPKDLLPDFLKRCSSKQQICSACALFGFIAGGNMESQNEADSSNDEAGAGSRVRFSDAWSKADNILAKESVLLPILSSPRTSSLEFYLRYHSNFYHADTEGVTLSGRKFYWHHPKFEIRNLKSERMPNMTSYMQYANKGARFDFVVYFDRITREQLDQLYTALTFGENDPNGRLCHKIGHGKPVGFGSVKIIVDQIVMRSFSVENLAKSYHVDDNGLSQVTPLPISKEVRIAADFESEQIMGKIIDYPRNCGKVYNWFSKNRPPRGEAKFFKKLPELLKEDGSLSDITLDENPQVNEKTSV